ncbi:MAG: ATP-binding protein [Chitinophagaceae bacterium]|jgi:hypothetical protein|nr:ATP-binding protein [Chitinophagaceae bacterium]
MENITILRILRSQIEKQLFSGKAILILGPRQAGKSTLLQQIFENSKEVLWLDAENADVPPLFEKPNITSLKNIIGSHKVLVIDESQKIVNIGSAIKLLTDHAKQIQVIATGSSSFSLRNQTNEPLTGRKWEHVLLPLSFEELVKHHGLLEERRNIPHRLVYGSYPEIVTHPGNEQNRLLLLTDSYLFRDILMWSGLKKPEKLVDLLKALSMQLGHEVSYNELGNLVGLKNETVENYIHLLEQAFVLFRLPAYSKNHRKELRKGRKVYFYDNGIRNAIIGDFRPVQIRNDAGALWENYVISEMIKKQANYMEHGSFYFWRTQDQQEIDLIIDRDGTLHAYEIKWNPKAKARLSKSFSETYPNHSYTVIHPDNIDKILLPETA